MGARRMPLTAKHTDAEIEARASVALAISAKAMEGMAEKFAAFEGGDDRFVRARIHLERQADLFRAMSSRDELAVRKALAALQYAAVVTCTHLLTPTP